MKKKRKLRKPLFTTLPLVWQQHLVLEYIELRNILILVANRAISQVLLKGTRATQRQIKFNRPLLGFLFPQNILATFALQRPIEKRCCRVYVRIYLSYRSINLRVLMAIPFLLFVLFFVIDILR